MAVFAKKNTELIWVEKNLLKIVERKKKECILCLVKYCEYFKHKLKMPLIVIPFSLSNLCSGLEGLGLILVEFYTRTAS